MLVAQPEAGHMIVLLIRRQHALQYDVYREFARPKDKK